MPLDQSSMFSRDKPCTPWDIFVWTAALFVAIIGIFFWQIESVRSQQTEQGKDLAVVKNNTAWIMKAVKNSPNGEVSLVLP